MLQQQDVPAFIAARMPEVKRDLSAGRNLPTAYSAIQVLTDHTKRLAFQHDFAGLRNCMILVHQIYQTGNSAVRNAVENIFVFAFSSILPRCNHMEWRLVQSCMPPELYTVYVRQVTCSKC
jgi:hypothetical protein